MVNPQAVSSDGVGNVNMGRHQSQCTICRHPQRDEIEQDYLHWLRTFWIVEHYKLSRYSFYRHVSAMGLDKKRRASILLPLERIIEDAGSAVFSGSAILAAFQLYIKLTGAGQEVKAVEGPSVKEEPNRTSAAQREVFARDGSLPSRISEGTDAAPGGGQIDTEPATDTAPGEGQEDSKQGVTTQSETVQ